MTVLEQMLEQTGSVVILGHVRPDGDCLGLDSGTLSLHSDQLSGHPGSGISGRKLTEVWISRRL